MSQSTKSKSNTKATKSVEPKEEPKVQEAVVEKVVEKKSTKKSSSKAVEPVQEAAPVKAVEKVEDVKSTKSSKKSTKKSAKKTKKVVKPKVVAKEEGVEGEQEKGKRYFHCVYKSNEGAVVRAGRYCGKKPKQAAKKALSRVVEKNEVKNGENLVFLIKECTRGSKKKMYAYSGARVLLDTPVTVPLKKVNKDGKPVVLTYKHANNVKKVALTECGDLVNVDFEEDDEVVAPVEAAPVVKVTKKSDTKKSSKKEEKVAAPVEAKQVPVEEVPKKKTSKKEEVKATAPVQTTAPKEEVKAEKTKTKSKSK